MTQMLSFLILISAGLFLSELLRRFHMPYVLALIATGVIIGPYVLGIFETDATIEFVGSIGLIFLMFMAGIEVRLSSIEKLKTKVAKISAINGLLPFAVGVAIAWYFGYGLLASAMLGIIFISSSIAVVIPSLESRGLIKKNVGKTIVGAAMVEDISSLLLLSVILQTASPSTSLPLPLFYFLVLVSLLILTYIIPRTRKFFLKRITAEKELFEQEIRLLFAILIGVVIFFEILGVHSIIAGFFTGLVLSDTLKSELLKKKLHAISYGLFIPVFFIIVGTQLDVSVFLGGPEALLLAVVVVVGSVVSKFLSGYMGGRAAGFSAAESKLVGACTIPQLSTTLAVAFIGLESGILDGKMIAAMVALSMVTIFVAPILISRFAGEMEALQTSQ